MFISMGAKAMMIPDIKSDGKDKPFGLSESFFMENNLGGKGKSWTWFNFAFDDDALFFISEKGRASNGARNPCRGGKVWYCVMPREV